MPTRRALAARADATKGSRMRQLDLVIAIKVLRFRYEGTKRAEQSNVRSIAHAESIPRWHYPPSGE